jgi:hypothetical protein
MNNKQICEALVTLGYQTGWVVRGDTFEGIEWVIEPEIKPTKKQVIDAIASLPTDEQKQVERATKLASAITKLKALGLTETEAKIIIGIE